MRIGILSQWFSPETGPASLPGVLARELARRGHQVRVLTGFPNYPTGRLYDGYSVATRSSSWEEGFGLRRVALYPDHSRSHMGRVANYGSFALSASIWGVSALREVDVIWVYNSPATVALPMWLAQLRYRVPVVLHNMDMWPDSLISTGFAPKRGGSLVLGALNRWVNAMYRASRFVAVLTPEAGVELTRRGVEPNRIRLAPTWIDEDVFFPADGARQREALGFTDADLVIGYAGALGRAQGVSGLARTVASLPAETPIRLLVLGSGSEADDIAEIAASAPRRVTYLGHVAHGEVGGFVAAFDYAYVGLAGTGHNAWAAPSKIPALLACGKPIIGCLVGDNAEMVGRSAAGFVVPPNDPDAMRRTLAELAARGRTEASRLGRVARRAYDDEMSAKRRLDKVEAILQEAAHS